jgi:succinate dehydrogenase / fumarate reductase flavoprotein subunit
VVLCTGGYGNAFFLSTNAMNCNVTAAWRAHRKGAYFANPCYTQIHPTCIPQADDTQSKLTLMSRVAAQRRPRVGAAQRGDERPADQIPEHERDYYLERCTPASATSPRATSRRVRPSVQSTPAAASAR